MDLFTRRPKFSVLVLRLYRYAPISYCGSADIRIRMPLLHAHTNSIAAQGVWLLRVQGGIRGNVTAICCTPIPTQYPT
jgi:hypothetical protein